MLFSFSTFKATKAPSRIISNNWQAFLEYCARKKIKTNSPLNCAIQLAHFFEFINVNTLPVTNLIQAHMMGFDKAWQNHTERLWCLNLAVFIRPIILNEKFVLKEEIVAAIGKDAAAQIRKALGMEELENLLCYALVKKSIYSMIHPCISPNRILDIIQTLRFVNYRDNSLNESCKIELINNLKISNSKADLIFWQELVDTGLIQRGGQPVYCLEDKKFYRVPDRIADMMACAKGAIDDGQSYEMFRDCLNVYRTTSTMISNPFVRYYRHPIVQGIYDVEDIETLNVAQFRLEFGQSPKARSGGTRSKNGM